MLAIFAFNLGGFYLLIWGLKVQANQEISARLDAGHYDASETFEVQVPLSLPYPLQSNGFERQSGQFTYQGLQYQVVGHKYENDMLTIVCLKDIKATHLEQVSNNFAENSGAHPANEAAPNFSLKVLQEYISSKMSLVKSATGWTQAIHATLYWIAQYQVDHSIFSPPPKG